MKSPFRLLLELFKARFFENDTVSPGGGFETNIYQVLGFLATPGFFVALYLMPSFMDLATQKPGPAVDWVLRVSRLFFPAYSFAVTGFATVFEWDMLFPDRRDFLILASFPIRLRDLFAAKFAALGLFLLTMVVAVNLFPALMVPVFSMAIPSVRTAGGMRVAAAQIAATAGASAFAFFAVAAFQGVLINLTSPRVFRRISPAIQMFGMSLMVLSLLLYPIYSMLLHSTAETHPQWLRLFPPFWFTGLYDLLLPHPDPLFASLGRFAVKALAIAAATFALSWALGFRRHYRRTLESEDTSSRAPSATRPERLIGTPEERAIFAFTGWSLARSTKHRLFLATYISVGLSIGLLVTIAVRAGKVGISQDGLRSFPFLIAFFIVSGFRAAFQFPAELASNWLFRITESRWGETSRSATRKRALMSGLAPALLLLLPLEIWSWGWQSGLLHIVFQLVSGALLIEVLFWSFGKVPFTCSYFPGRINLALLFVLYLYGFTSYSFQLADLEHALDGHAGRALLFFAATGVALIALWRRHPAASAISFDAYEPHIQTLDLT
jgi:hypothetical protein